jgi:hypothetical protein
VQKYCVWIGPSSVQKDIRLDYSVLENLMCTLTQTV